MKPIDADAIKLPKGFFEEVDNVPKFYEWLNELPTIDAVSRGVHEQVMWERDLAISQLNEIGKSLGEKMDNVATVVRCKDCRWKEKEQPGMVYCPAVVGGWVDEDWFCKGGERSEE